jgi:hypothetical protein
MKKENKDAQNMPDNLKTDPTDIEKYPDHMKTHPEAKKEFPADTPMEENLDQDPQPYNA